MTTLTITLTAPVWLPLLGFIVALMVEAFGYPRAAVTTVWIALIVSAVIAAAGSNMTRLLILDRAAVAGGGVSLLAAVVLSCAAVAVIAGAPRMSASAAGARTAALMAASASAAVTALGARDLLLLVVALEAVALAGYALVAAGSSRKAAVASTTYFVQGAIAAGLLLFGVGALIVLVAGTRLGIDTSDTRMVLSLIHGGVTPALTALGLTATALLFKAGAFPLHSWVPDAYESADPAPAALLASVPKTAALVALAVLSASFGVTVLGVAGPGAFIPRVAAFVAAASVAFGTFAGLKQRDYRRMLGYSSIAQAGFALMGLVVGGPRAVVLVSLMAGVYALATVGAFTAAEAWRAARPDWDGSIAGMRGLGSARPLLGVALATVLFSLTGIPPLAGFWGKLAVFTAAIGTGRYLWLAIVGALASVVSFGYYGKVLRAVWLEPAGGDDGAAQADPRDSGRDRMQPAPEERWATVAVVLSALAVLAVGLLPLVFGGAVFNLLGR